MNAEGICPICKSPLTVNSDHKQVQFCSSCRREYYSIEDDQDNERLQYDDIESLSDNNEGPILLCEKTKESKPDSYLRRHFGSGVEITSEVYIPE